MRSSDLGACSWPACCWSAAAATCRTVGRRPEPSRRRRDARLDRRRRRRRPEPDDEPRADPRAAVRRQRRHAARRPARRSRGSACATSRCAPTAAAPTTRRATPSRTPACRQPARPARRHRAGRRRQLPGHRPPHVGHAALRVPARPAPRRPGPGHGRRRRLRLRGARHADHVVPLGRGRCASSGRRAGPAGRGADPGDDHALDLPHPGGPRRGQLLGRPVRQPRAPHRQDRRPREDPTRRAVRVGGCPTSPAADGCRACSSTAATG